MVDYAVNINPEDQPVVDEPLIQQTPPPAPLVSPVSPTTTEQLSNLGGNMATDAAKTALASTTPVDNPDPLSMFKPPANESDRWKKNMKTLYQNMGDGKWKAERKQFWKELAADQEAPPEGVDPLTWRQIRKDFYKDLEMDGMGENWKRNRKLLFGWDPAAAEAGAVDGTVAAATAPAPAPGRTGIATQTEYQTGADDGKLKPEDAVKYGLGTGQNLLKEAMDRKYLYPEDISGQMKGPGEYDFFNRVGNAAMERVQGPGEYVDPAFQAQFGMGAGQVGSQGFNQTAIGGPERIEGGDYASLEEKLRAPGEMAAERAYSESMADLQNKMGASGLYGSSMMGNQMVDIGARKAETLAQNAAQAAEKRFGMQQEDIKMVNEYEQRKAGMNIDQQKFLSDFEQAVTTGNAERMQQMQLQAAQFGLSQDELSMANRKAKSAHQLQQAELAQTAIKDRYAAGVTDAERRQQYLAQRQAFDIAQDDRQNAFFNQQLKDKFNYDLGSEAWKSSIQEMLMNQSLALAGQGAPLASAALQSQAAKDAAKTAAKGAENAAMMEALGTGAGMAGKGLIDWYTG